MFKFLKNALDSVRSVFRGSSPSASPSPTQSSRSSSFIERVRGFFGGLIGKKPIEEAPPRWKIPEASYSEGRISEAWDYDIGIDINRVRDILASDPIPQANIIRVIVYYVDREDEDAIFTTKDHDFRTSATPEGSAERVIELYQDIIDRYQIQTVTNITVRLLRRFKR